MAAESQVNHIRVISYFQLQHQDIWCINVNKTCFDFILHHLKTCSCIGARILSLKLIRIDYSLIHHNVIYLQNLTNPLVL